MAGRLESRAFSMSDIIPSVKMSSLARASIENLKRKMATTVNTSHVMRGAQTVSPERWNLWRKFPA